MYIMETRYHTIHWFLLIFTQLSLIHFVVSGEKDGAQLISNDNTTRTDFCPELFSTSLVIDCLYKEKPISCDDPPPNGTVAKLKCKSFYYLENLPFDELHCQNGAWNQPLFDCVSVCGTKSPKTTPFDVNGKTAEKGDFPWHAGLYIKKNTHHEYICGGSILSPKLVITAAHCVSKPTPKIYKVAAGKVHRDWNHENDDIAQYRDVVNIVNEKNYQLESIEYMSDIAILVLNEVFILSDMIQPICLDYISTTLDTSKHNVGIVSGWGLTSEKKIASDDLQYALLPLEDRENCLRMFPSNLTAQVTLDKICTGYTNDTSVCTEDSGGGLISSTKINDTNIQYFLIGIVSVGPFKQGSCDSYQYTTFTTIASHINWINETKIKYDTWSPYDYGCHLPEIPDFGNYTVDGDIPNKRELFPGYRVPHYTKLKYSCNTGYKLHGNELITCKDKLWNVTNFPVCFQTCYKLNSTDLDIEYLLENGAKLTDDVILHGTRALFRCKDINFELDTFTHYQTVCRDGKWTELLPKCIPVCGVKTAFDDDRMNNVSIVNNYPWNIGIYRIMTNNFQLECAGSIISLFLVFTEPQCVNEMNIHEYIVIAGSVQKYIQSTTNQNIQKSTIYRKIPNNYYDILVLKKRFELTSFVLPACLRPIETVFIENENIELEIPYWTREDDSLKIIQIETDQYLVNEFPTHLNFTTDITDYAVGGVTIQFRRSTDIRYCIVGFATGNGIENMFFFMKPDLIFVQLVMARYDIRSSEISECMVPAISKRVRTIENVYNTGNFVLNGTKIKYTCEKYSNLYGSDEITCKNSTWMYSSGHPYCLECGISHFKVPRYPSNQIQNSVNPVHVPWNVGIYKKEKESPKFLCFGTIISPKIILTLKYCVEEYNNTKYTDGAKYYVEAGQHNWNTILDTNIQQVDVEEVLYNGLYLKITVLILNKYLQMHENVVPICLDLRGDIKYFDSPTYGVLPDQHIEEGNITSTNMDITYISSSSLRKFNVFSDVLYTHRFHCVDGKGTGTKGSALVFNTQTNKNKNRYFIHSLFRFINCETNQMYFIDLFKHVKWLDSILRIYK